MRYSRAVRAQVWAMLRGCTSVVFVLPLLIGAALQACSQDKAQALAGTWMEVDGTDYAIVRPTEEGWIFEDDGGRYPAVYEGGVLKISTGLGEVTGIYDSETGMMLLRVGTREMDFKRADCSGFLTGRYLEKRGYGRFYFGEDCTFKQGDYYEEVRSWGAYDVKDSSIALHLASEGEPTVALTGQIRNGEIGIEDFVLVREGTEAYAEAVDREKALLQESKDKAYSAAMKSDLRNLAREQEGYLAGHGIYASTLDQLLEYDASAGVTVTISNASRTAWEATASHTGTTRTCTIAVGSTLRTGMTERVPYCR